MGKILVVDDDMMNRRMAQYILSKAGHESETVESGEEAIRSIEREEYDLVLLDIEMPEMNGFDTLKKIRTLERGADLPVMFLTASNDARDQNRAEELHAVGYVNKPFLPQNLMSQVNKLLGE